MPEFYTMATLRLNQLGEIGEKQLSVFGSRGGQRTSDGGNGNHSVSLPIILIKNKVDQKFPSSYISLLLVSILWFCI